MSQPAAGLAPSAQQSSNRDEAVQQSNSWEHFRMASEMHQCKYLVGTKHRNLLYEQVYADQVYVCWVKAHWKEPDATQEQRRFLHYIQLREREAGAGAEPVPAELPLDDPAEEEYELLEQEAGAVTAEQLANGAVTAEQLAARVGHVERVLQELMEGLRLDSAVQL